MTIMHIALYTKKDKNSLKPLTADMDYIQSLIFNNTIFN